MPILQGAETRQLRVLWLWLGAKYVYARHTVNRKWLVQGRLLSHTVLVRVHSSNLVHVQHRYCSKYQRKRNFTCSLVPCLHTCGSVHLCNVLAHVATGCASAVKKHIGSADVTFTIEAQCGNSQPSRSRYTARPESG